MAEAPPTQTRGEHVPAREALAPGHSHHGLALEVRDLWAGYAGQPPVIEAIDFVVPEGELVGLVGPNGAGKSTLFKSILGLIRPLRGEVRIFGRPIAEARADISYMPQVDEVDWDFPVSVLDVVLMGRWRRTRPFSRWTAEDRGHAAEAIERVGLADFAGRQVGQLSGGQRRRVLMARAIARGARLLLLDEPFAGLDAAVQHDLIAILDGLTQDGRSVLVATHDLSCVAASCDEACCLNRRVQGFGPPSEVLTEEVLSRTFQRHLLAVAHQPALVVAEDEHQGSARGRGAGGGA
ncbi:MAG: metal ABC transporter ATP-binding protein [Chloroflexi bacterium]|nr:metal ABC transporter ATP-binding protein [Chloroflexota bacterium]